MKRTLIFLSLSVTLALSACVKDAAQRCSAKDSTASATAAERAAISAYLANHSLTATEHPSGVFYTITTNGVGETPGICAQVTVRYKGYLLGSITPFGSDETAAGVSFLLRGLIVGWQKGLSILQSGGSITLYIPPSLGYGSVEQTNNGTVIIPANSYLQFDIDLLNVVNL